MNWLEDTTATILGAFLTGVAGPLILQWYNLKAKRRLLSKKDKVVDDIKQSKPILHKLEYIKEEYGADRVWITQFHNGGNFYPTGKSIQKFSMFYEVLEPSVPSIKMNFQNIPVTLFSKTTEVMYQKGYIAIPDYSDPTVENYGLKYIAEETETLSYYGFAIFCVEGKLIGSLGVEYVKHKKKLTKDEIQSLEVEAATLGGVLINYLNQP